MLVIDVFLVIIAIGALWGILTLISLGEEEKYIQELCESARKAITKQQNDKVEL